MTRMSSIVTSARQLVGRRDRKKFVESVKPREVITLPAVEKTFLPHVNVEEPQERTEGKTLGKKFQLSPATDGAATDPGVAAGKFALGRNARFPIRVAVMFFDEHFHGWKGVVIHLATQPAGRAFHDDVFVDFVVAALRVGLRQFFVTA